MNKLLTTLGTIILLSSGVSPLATINNHKVATIHSKTTSSTFNLWDLSTWGDTQKATIIKNYLAIAKKYYNQPNPIKTWSQWSNPSYETQALISSFQLINHAFNIHSFNFTVEPYPSGSSDLGKDLLNGIHYYITALPSTGFTWQIDFIVKGKITPKTTPWDPLKPSHKIKPNQKEADAIKYKLDADIGKYSFDLLPDYNPYTSNPITLQAIKNEIWNNTKQNLSLSEFKDITVKKVKLLINSYINVPLIITVGTGKEQGKALSHILQELNLTTGIIGAVEDHYVKIPYNSVKTVKANALAIKLALQKMNPLLINDYLAKIFFNQNPTSLVVGSFNKVIFEVGNPYLLDSYTFYVEMNPKPTNNN